MTALDLLQQLHELGVMMTPSPDGTVRCRAPKGVLTPALREAIRARKAEVLDLLEEFGERAAILEIEAYLPRAEAEALAWQCVLGKEASWT